MTETLRQKQSRFAVGLQLLLEYAHKQGYDITLGETYRHPVQAEVNALSDKDRAFIATLIQHQYGSLAVALRAHKGKGIRNSLHTKRLAVDLQLFKDGIWVQDVAPYKMLGVYWKTLGPGFCWGGDFGDTPHYSITHEGVR